jgi:hypothetical protein
MVRKSPDKQWNRQNFILFHETLPLNVDNCNNSMQLYRFLNIVIQILICTITKSICERKEVNTIKFYRF